MIACLSLLLALASAAPVATDVLTLKSGRQIEGRCTVADDREIVFVDTNGRELRLVWSLVRQLERADHPPDLFGLALPPASDERPGGYVRYRPPRDGGAGALSTGVSRWHHAETDTTLFLVGAVHIGEPEYFAHLQRLLDQMDVVLFEGVKPAEGAGISVDDLQRLDTITQLQITMKKLLGLQFQSDAVAYDRRAWENADVNVAELQAELDRRGVSLPTDNPLFQLLLKVIAGPLDVAAANPDPVMQRRLRRQMAPVLAQVEQYSSTPQMKGFMDVVVNFRNERVMEHLQGRLEEEARGRRLAIFYGSAHLPDFDRRLESSGWTYRGCTFVEAWKIR